MPIVEVKRFAPSKAMYAFKLDSFTTGRGGEQTLPAVWVKKKSGVLWVSEGTIRDRGHANLDDFFARFDCRYGGQAVYTWDGVFMNSHDTPLVDMVAASKRLTAVLDVLPNVPVGYSGWYSLIP